MTWKVFWYPCGLRHGNFGDMLTPMLLDHFNVRYEWAKAEGADLIGIGSVCEKIPAGFEGIIWTSGNLRENHRNHFPQAQVIALRGHLTHQRTQCAAPDKVLLGDGGLLSFLLASPIRRRYKLGVIPHYVDDDHETVKMIACSSGEICLIDICDEPRSVVHRVAQCENILSSSLHGLILADSLGIPNRWMQAFGEVIGGGFKFRDYYSVYGIERARPLIVSPTDSLDTLLPHISDYDRPGIAQLQERILKSLRDVLGTKRPTSRISRAAKRRSIVQFKRQANREECERPPTQPTTSSNVPSTCRRIFVVGTGRSGTCWMGQLLGTHPSIRSFVEPKPVFDLVTTLAVDPQRQKDLLDQTFREYDRLFDRAHPFHLADKTHPALWIATQLASRYDDSLFVAMARDVEPTVASMLQHTGVRRWCEEWERYPVPNRFLGITLDNVEWYRKASVLERCVARWWAHQKEIVRLASILGTRFLTVKFETLATDTSSTLETVRTFIGLQEQFPPASASIESLMKWKKYLTHQDVNVIHRTLTFLSQSVSSAVT